MSAAEKAVRSHAPTPPKPATAGAWARTPARFSEEVVHIKDAAGSTVLVDVGPFPVNAAGGAYGETGPQRLSASPSYLRSTSRTSLVGCDTHNRWCKATSRDKYGV